MSKIVNFSKFRERNTSYKEELVAGITTFTTMAYVLVVQPGAIVGYGDAAFIIDANGAMIVKEAIVATCTIISGLITLLTALYANLPFTLAAGMESNSMFRVLIQSQQLSFGGVMAIALISGVIFPPLTIFDIRDLVVEAMPKDTKISISTAIDFFIAYLGLKNTGITASTENGVDIGDFTDPAVMLTVLGLVIIIILTACKVNGAVLIGIIIVTLLRMPAGVTTMPSTPIKVSDFAGLGNVMLNLDSKSVFGFSSAIPIFTTLCGDFFSMLGTIPGASAKAGMLDKNGDLPNIQQPFLIDTIGTYIGALTDNTVITIFVESSVGVGVGGRTGFAGTVVSVIFMIMVFLSPLVLVIPNAATGPTLIFVGFLMISGSKDIDFTDFTESFGPLVMIMFTVSIGSIASGTSAGILAFVLIKTATGKFREVHPIMYVMATSLICYLIYG